MMQNTTIYQPATETIGEVNGGTQRIYKFANGYGASVIQSYMSYGGDRGLWELAVLDSNEHLCYDTPVTNDVIGYLTEEQVQEYLAQIDALPAKG